MPISKRLHRRTPGTDGFAQDNTARGSSRPVAAVVVGATASAATYVVGDDAGWDTAVDYDAWARGKKFKVGDTLVFRYDAQGPQDVVVVDARGYAECTAPDNAPALISGDDHVVLGQAGQFFFICEAEGECEGGMKLAVTVH